jgi:hypothetical protein
MTIAAACEEFVFQVRQRTLHKRPKNVQLTFEISPSAGLATGFSLAPTYPGYEAEDFVTYLPIC